VRLAHGPARAMRPRLRLLAHPLDALSITPGSRRLGKGGARDRLIIVRQGTRDQIISLSLVLALEIATGKPLHIRLEPAA